MTRSPLRVAFACGIAVGALGGPGSSLRAQSWIGTIGDAGSQSAPRTLPAPASDLFRYLPEDVPRSDPDSAYIAQATRDGLVLWPGLRFLPDQSASIYEWASVVAGVLRDVGIEETSTASLPPDVPEDHWAAPHVRRALAVLEPAATDRFHGDQVVTTARLRRDYARLMAFVNLPSPGSTTKSSLLTSPEGATPATRRVIARVGEICLLQARPLREDLAERLTKVDRESLAMVDRLGAFSVSVADWERRKDTSELLLLQDQLREVARALDVTRRELDSIHFRGVLRSKGRSRTEADRALAESLLEEMEGQLVALRTRLEP